MSVPDQPFDPGLQPERTLLAWRRTFLALGVAGAVAVRFAAEVSLYVAIPLGLALVALALTGYLRVARRYRRVHEGLHARGELATGGVTITIMALTLLIVALSVVVYLVGMIAELASAPG